MGQPRIAHWSPVVIYALLAHEWPIDHSNTIHVSPMGLQLLGMGRTWLIHGSRMGLYTAGPWVSRPWISGCDAYLTSIIDALSTGIACWPMGRQ